MSIKRLYFKCLKQNKKRQRNITTRISYGAFGTKEKKHQQNRNKVIVCNEKFSK